MRQWRRCTGAFFGCFILILLMISGCSGDSEQNTASSEDISVQVNQTGVANEGETSRQSTVKDRVIAVSMPFASEGWDYEAFLCAKDRLSRISDDQTGYVLMTASSGEEQSVQLNELVGQNVHSVVIYPVDSVSVAEAIASLKASGIPVIVFNGAQDDGTAADGADAAVIMDESLLGRDAADAVNNAGCDGLEILVFANEEQEETLERIQGFKDTLNQNITMVFGGNVSGSTASARQAMLDWIDTQDSDAKASVGGIFAADGDTLLGILEALDSYESANGTVFPELQIIAGCGSTSQLMAWISENDRYPVRTWFYSPDTVSTAIDLAVEAADGTSVESQVAVEPSTADHDNVKKVIAY